MRSNMYQCDNCKHGPGCPGYLYKKVILTLSEKEMRKLNDAVANSKVYSYLHMDIVCDRYEPYPSLNTKPDKPSVKVIPVPFIFIDERSKNS